MRSYLCECVRVCTNVCFRGHCVCVCVHFQVLISTYVFARVEMWCGFYNLAYLCLLGMTSWLTGYGWDMFLAGSSFVHYIFYISTYYAR